MAWYMCFALYFLLCLTIPAYSSQIVPRQTFTAAPFTTSTAPDTPFNSSLPSSQGSTTSSAAWIFIIEHSWLTVPIVAAISWINTWIIGAIIASNSGWDYGFVADRRYAGLAKRTINPALLAEEKNCSPSAVVGCAITDPGLSSQLKDLDNQFYYAGAFGFTSWVIQIFTTLWAIVSASIVWNENAVLRQQKFLLQMQQMLGCLNINRGCWSIAVIGCLVPYKRLQYLYFTTALAVVIEVIFIARAFLIASGIPKDISAGLTILAYLFPALEGSVFIAGMIAGAFKVTYISPMYGLAVPSAMWLALGPFVVILISVLGHFVASPT